MQDVLQTQVIGYNIANDKEEIDKNNYLQYVSPQDLRSFGLIPELIGRLPVVAYLEPLDRSALRRILTEPKNAIIKQYIKLFDMDGIKLSFDKSALEMITDKAIEFKLGARGLRSICETIMTDAMFEAPTSNEKELKISNRYVVDKLKKSNFNKLKVA